MRMMTTKTKKKKSTDKTNSLALTHFLKIKIFS